MKKGDMRVPVKILLMVVVFIIVLAILYKLMGSPECDGLANTTAYQLADSINSVSDANFPYWDISKGPPTDGDSAYYRRTPIRLCQQNYGDYQNLLSFAGGEPEYKIYWEKFPEGSGAWRENYPWSGGQASTLLFWSAMRGISLGTMALSKLGVLQKAGKWLFATSGIEERLSQVNNQASYAGKFLGPEGFVGDQAWQQIVADVESGTTTKDVTDLATYSSQQEFKAAANAWGDAGFIEKEGDCLSDTSCKIAFNPQTGKILVNNIPQPLEIIEKNPTTGEISGVEQLAYKTCAGCASGYDFGQTVTYDSYKDDVPQSPYNIINGQPSVIGVQLGSPAPPGYELQYYNPSEMVDDIENEYAVSSDPVERQAAEQMDNTWTSDSTTASSGTISEVMDGSTLYNQEFYQSGPMRFSEEMNVLSTQGVVLENGKTVFYITKGPGVMNFMQMEEENFGGALSDVINGPSGQQIMKVLQDDSTGIPGEISAITGEVSPDKAADLDALYGENGIYKLGSINSAEAPMIGLPPTDWRLSLYEGAEMEIAKGVANPDTALNDLQKIMPRYGDIGLTDQQFGDIFTKVQSLYDPDNPTKSYLEAYLGDWSNYMSTNPPAGDPWAEEGESFLESSFKPGSKTWYSKLVGIKNAVNNMDWRYKRIATMIWFKVRDFITPTSAIARGLFLYSQEGCQGNSICVYSHGSLTESPFYMADSVKDYSVKLWRPVSAWGKYGGLTTGLMMQVPEHPRFYAVGPCFAEAKVWKAMYNGDRTIFVSLKKFDLNDTASNYCYADENLINGYATVWFAQDMAEVAQVVVMATNPGEEFNEALQAYTKSTYVKVFQFLDPSTLIRSVGEYMLRWPGSPFKPLTWNEMAAGAANVSINAAKEAKQTAE